MTVVLLPLTMRTFILLALMLFLNPFAVLALSGAQLTTGISF